MVPRETQNIVWPKRVNWKDVLADLRAKGLSIARIAREIGKGENTLQAWFRGHEPAHSSGDALLTLHARYCGPEQTQLRKEQAQLAEVD